MFKRSRYVVNKKLQGAYVRMVILPMVLIALAVLLAQHYTYWFSFYWSFLGKPEIISYLDNWYTLDITKEGLGIKIFFLIAIFGAVGILNSHRVAGPLYKIEKILRGVSQGNIRERLILRKNDELHEVAAVINQFLHNLTDSIAKFKDSSRNIGVAVKELKSELEKDAPSLASLRQKIFSIDNALEILSVESSRFQI